MPRDYTAGLKKSELEHGAYYRGVCRNATEARWHEDFQLFFHWRVKFGHKFLETIRHPEDEQTFDVFNAFAKVDEPKDPFHWPEDMTNYAGERYYHN
jgi:hypothetical protein